MSCYGCKMLESPRKMDRIYRHVFDEDSRCIGSIDVDGFFNRCLNRHRNKHKKFYGILALICCISLLWLFGYHWGQFLPQYMNKKSIERVSIARHVEKLPTDIGYILPQSTISKHQKASTRIVPDRRLVLVIKALIIFFRTIFVFKQ